MPTSRQRRSFQRTHHEIVRASHRGLERVSFIGLTAGLLRDAVPYDGACWHTVDPASLLITSHHTNLSGAGFAFICRNEYMQEDFNKFATLAGRFRPVAVLSETTAGRPERSTRFREIYRPRDWGSEMRASLDAVDVTWGSAMLLREAGRPDFTGAEATFVAALGRHIAHGLRSSLLLDAASDGQDAEPGWIVLDRRNQIEAATPGVECWLEELAGLDLADTGALPAPLLAVAAHVRRLAADEQATAPARLRTRAPSGLWLVIHGSLLTDPPDGRVRLIIEPSTRSEIAPIIVKAYGLTSREREVAALALRGLTSGQMATTLCISIDTVHDHLKSIYEKTSAHSRREFIARVFGEHFQPHLAAGTAVGSDGWFRPQQTSFG